MKPQSYSTEDFFKIHSTRGGKFIAVTINGEMELLIYRTFKKLNCVFELTGSERDTRYKIVSDIITIVR